MLNNLGNLVKASFAYENQKVNYQSCDVINRKQFTAEKMQLWNYFQENNKPREMFITFEPVKLEHIKNMFWISSEKTEFIF